MIDKTKSDFNPYVIGTVVNCDALRIRREPSFDSEILSIIDAGTRLKLLPENNEWYKVSKFKGVTGYVAANYVQPTVATR